MRANARARSACADAHASHATRESQRALLIYASDFVLFVRLCIVFLVCLICSQFCMLRLVGDVSGANGSLATTQSLIDGYAIGAGA